MLASDSAMKLLGEMQGKYWGHGVTILCGGVGEDLAEEVTVYVPEGGVEESDM